MTTCLGAYAPLTWAACTTVSTTTTCLNASTTPEVGGGQGAAHDNESIYIGDPSGSTTAALTIGDDSAISAQDNNRIEIGVNSTVSNVAVSSNGSFGKGGNTVEFGSNNQLIIDAGASLLSNGTQTSAEAINPQGTGNTITNNGSIVAINAAAIWFDGGGPNTVINNGILTGKTTAISSSGTLIFTNTGTTTGAVTAGATSTMSNSGTINGAVTAGATSVVTNTGKITGTLSVGAGSTVTLGAGSSNVAVTIAGAGNTLSVDATSTLGTLTLSGTTNHLTLTGASTTSATWSTALTTFSQITKAGAGIWKLAPTAAPAAGATIHVAGGTLQLGAANLASTASMTVDTGAELMGPGADMSAVVVDNGLVDFNETAGSTYAGVVSGTGAVLKDGTGTLTLTHANTFTGATTIASGTVLANAASALGATSAIDVQSGATLRTNIAGAIGATTAMQVDGTFNLNSTNQSIGTLSGAGSGVVTLGTASLTTQSNSDSEFDGVISGTGSLTKSGSGMLTLTGTNTYSGTTTITAGTLQIGAGATTGSIAGNIIDDAALAFNRSDAATYTGAISGSGTVTQSGSGTLSLSANNTYTGLTTIAAGTLALGTGGSAGSVAGDILNNAALAFNRNDIWTYGGNISGSGSLTQSGTGTTILTGDISNTGITTISAGTLQLGNGGTTGDLTGDVVDNATLALDRSDALVFSNVISGSGNVVQSGSGTVALTADNTYTGTTTIAAGGTLQLGNGGTTGSIISNVANAGTLVFDRTDSLTFSPSISGAGDVTQAGTGTIRFDTPQSYTGTTSIDAGTLEVDSTLASSTIIVAAGTTLSGTGVASGNVINNGTVSPGDPLTLPSRATTAASPSAFTVLGNYTGNGGRIAIRSVLNAGGSGNQTTDRLLVAGTLGGTSTLVVTPLAGSIGAQTGNLATDGISVVQAGPASSSAALTLAGGYVAGGPYQFRLYTYGPGQSSLANMDPKLAAAGLANYTDYRLQTVTVLSSDPGTPSSPGAPVGVGPNGEAPGTPVVVPQVPAYQALPTGAIAYGLALADEFHKRAGDLAPASEDGIDANSTELFTRAKDWRANIGSGAQASYDQHLWFAQTGAGVVMPNVFEAGDRVHLDVVLSQGGSTSEVLVNQATTHFDATSIGAAATYLAPNGAYLDGVVEGVFYDNVTFNTQQRGQVGTTVGRAAIASLQTGLPLHADATTTFEPRASLTFQHVGFNSMIDVDRVSDNPGSTNSLVADVGLRLQHRWDFSAAGKSVSIEPFTSIDYANELLGANRIVAGGVDFASANAGHYMRVGGGVSVRVGANLGAYIGFEHDMSVAHSSPTGNEYVATLNMRF